jgi:hypothetical protein
MVVGTCWGFPVGSPELSAASTRSAWLAGRVAVDEAAERTLQAKILSVNP